jgi:hypothetical protein
MRTEAQNEASGINGAKSNGPKTPQGKAISSANSSRHGLTAIAILLTNEEPAKYHTLAEAYYKKLQPADAALFDREMDSQTKKVNAQFPKIDHASRYALAGC